MSEAVKEITEKLDRAILDCTRDDVYILLKIVVLRPEDHHNYVEKLSECGKEAFSCLLLLMVLLMTK